MRAIVYRLAVCGALLWSSTLSMSAAAQDLFVVRPTARTPEEVVEAIKAYADGKKWVFTGASKVKPPQGEVTFVKVCIPEVGRLLWPLGLHISAMLPCGNFGIYQKGGKTEISMLHPRYMQMLYPHPEVEKASAVATPLFMDMLDKVAK